MFRLIHNITVYRQMNSYLPIDDAFATIKNNRKYTRRLASTYLFLMFYVHFIAYYLMVVGAQFSTDSEPPMTTYISQVWMKLLELILLEGENSIETLQNVTHSFVVIMHSMYVVVLFSNLFDWALKQF